MSYERNLRLQDLQLFSRSLCLLSWNRSKRKHWAVGQTSSKLQVLIEEKMSNLANNVKAFLQKMPEVAILLQEGESNAYIKNR